MQTQLRTGCIEGQGGMKTNHTLFFNVIGGVIKPGAVALFQKGLPQRQRSY